MKNTQVYQLDRKSYPGLINPSWKVNYLLIQVKVSGQRGPSIIAPLLVDSGATFTSLSPTILKTIGCDLNNPLKSVPIITGGGTKNIPVFQVPLFEYQEYRKPNFPVLAFDLPKQSTDWWGILGMDFLEQCHCIISFAEGKIRFGSM